MRIAYFSANYPPLLDAEALVSEKVVEELRRQGHELRVFAAPATNRASRTRLERATLTGWALLRHGIRMARRRTGDPGRLPEIDCYVTAALKSAQYEHSQRPFQLIVSRYEPIESAIAAWWFRQGSALQWIAVYNDPIPRVPERAADTLGSLLQRVRLLWMSQWAARLLRDPDVLVFPNAQLLERAAGTVGVTHLSPSLRAKSRVIPHIGGPIGVRPSAPVRSTRGSILTIRHVGSLGHRRPVTPLLEALEALQKRCGEKIRLEFVGNCDAHRMELDAFAKRSAEWLSLSCQPPVGPYRAFELMQAADVCVLIEEPAGIGLFLPSKFCDYARAFRPILAFTPERSPVRDYLRRFGGGIAVGYAQPTESARALQALILSEPSAALAEEFSEEKVGSRWREALGAIQSLEHSA